MQLVRRGICRVKEWDEGSMQGGGSAGWMEWAPWPHSQAGIDFLRAKAGRLGAGSAQGCHLPCEQGLGVRCWLGHAEDQIKQVHIKTWPSCPVKSLQIRWKSFPECSLWAESTMAHTAPDGRLKAGEVSSDSSTMKGSAGRCCCIVLINTWKHCYRHTQKAEKA